MVDHAQLELRETSFYFRMALQRENHLATENHPDDIQVDGRIAKYFFGDFLVDRVRLACRRQ